MHSFRYEIHPHPGGWQLRLYEDATEVGGGTYPTEEYDDARSEGADWVSSRIGELEIEEK